MVGHPQARIIRMGYSMRGELKGWVGWVLQARINDGRRRDQIR